MPAQPAASHTGTATILFTDLVGSTAQRAHLGEETAETLRRAHDRLLTDAVAAHHGTVAKSVGDGIMATFPGAAEAVGAAVAIQQAVEAHNRRTAPAPLAVRIGISLGDVTWEGVDCFGTPVIEAARLCAVAEGGQILAADLVRLTARGRGGHTFTPIGPVALKGLPEAVVACAVAWEPLAPVAVSLPPRLGTRSAFAMFGRGPEAEALGLAWAKAKDGQRQVVLLAGEPGIGKTRLATETARTAYAEGGTVLFGGCDEDIGLPYRPFVEALRHYVAHAPGAVLAAHVRAHHGELARLVPELAQRVLDVPAPQVAEAETERFLLFEAVAGLLAAASQESPLVLVLDDLHWAGMPELLLLKHLVRSAEPLRLLVIGTYRDTDLSRTHPLTAVLADLRRESGVERVALHGLDDAAVETLVAAVARHDLDATLIALAHAVRRETEGNPFFIGEVIRHLSESGALFQESGRWTYRGDIAGLGIPEGVREVIGRRLGRLSEATSRILSLAAVIGRQFDVPLLAKIAEASEDAVLDALDEATAAALVSEVRGSAETFTFRHALIRTTLYEELSATRRGRLHRRVGEALEDLAHGKPGSRIEELAHHWLAATQAADAAKAIAYARQAGDRALAALAPFDALRYYAQALELYPQVPGADPVLGIDLAIGLGMAQRLTGDPSFRDTLLGAARRAADLDDTNRLVAAALGTCWGIFTDTGVIDPEKVQILELALDRLPGRIPDRARLLATLCGELSYLTTLERRRALADEAIAIAESSGNDSTIADVLNHVAIPLQVPPLFEQSLAQTAEALLRAERTGDPGLLVAAVGLRAEAAAQAGDIGEMDRCLEIEAALATRLDQPILTWLHTYRRSLRAQIVGDTDRAEHLATEALQIGPGGRQTVAVVFGAQVMGVHVQRGTIGTIIPLIEQSVADNPGIPAFKAGLASAHAEVDRTGEAHRLLKDFAATDFSLPMDQAWISGMVGYAAAAIECRDPNYAQPLFDRLAPYARMLSTAGGASAQGPVSGYLGGLATVLGRYGEADTYLAQSAAMSARIGAKYFAAWTDLLWGKMLVERKAPGDTEKARELLTKARTIAAANKYGTIERRAIEALSHLD